ncbi:T9SS type A sorting domain-containing protein [Limnovirga soli]|uniref:T9SS type A sorting domain-containing protein n=1 Tax=Limnovirga soli TaxID=2656915 RepID=A0A8J8FA10_9BACT|nr:T9SS type A sorting domain-containing protein [Limnovirga soli]NNV53905.1 T9SS type A sorting domain-containing protein [Limnovirga soli]
MKNLTASALLFLFCIQAVAQTASSADTSGTWQSYGSLLDKAKYPEIKGRLFNYNWRDLETSPNVWNWVQFDNDLNAWAADSLPVILLIYTKEDAPDWLYKNGVPKVTEKDEQGNSIGYSPYYADTDYKRFFKRMITNVHQHLETLPTGTRKQVIAIQACLGNTGDYIGYKGIVDAKYALTADEFFELYKEFSLYYYNEYANTSPKIYHLSNPSNDGADETNWLMANCPGSWLKTGSIGKGYQLNDELSKSRWLYDIMNKPQNGVYIKTRSEISGPSTMAGTWLKAPYKNMYALMCYDIYWGLDINNQSGSQIQDSLQDAALSFFNKYAGQKDGLKSTNALCALRDGLDCTDTVRFPIAEFGVLNRKDSTRYKNIVNRFTAFGARLDDATAATQDELSNLAAAGINDVGWDIFRGNYERHLHQLLPNETSIGYWNVNAPADSTAMYGRFARGFDIANGKKALYFDIDDSSFLNRAPVNAAYPVSIDITYRDSGYGSFRLYYDAKGGIEKPSIQVTCTNSGSWKKASVTLYDGYFGNRSANNSDFYIKSTNSKNVIFSTIELSRPNPDKSDIGFAATSLSNFDTLCVNATSTKNILLKAAFLTGTNVVVGPLKGYVFSLTANGLFTDSLIINDYGTTINKTIYVQFKPLAPGVYNGTLIISGGGVSAINIPVSGVAINSIPQISALVSNVTCNGKKNGFINLTLTGGNAPFTYSWTSADFNTFKSSSEDIADLKPASYSVDIVAKAGCKISNTYTIAEPATLEVAIIKDSDILCKGGTTTITVTASGGVLPYTGVGVFTGNAGTNNFTVTDSNGCTATNKIVLTNGTAVAPSKPLEIFSPVADEAGVCGGGKFSFYIDTVPTATSYTWVPPAGAIITQTSTNGTGINIKVPSTFVAAPISVTANNACGSSFAAIKAVNLIPAAPAAISGPVTVVKNTVGLVYTVTPIISGLTYTWTANNGVKITAGQNTPSITVTWGNLAGRLTVKASNSCGFSPITTLDIGITAAFADTATAANLFAASTIIQKPAVFYVAPNPVTDKAMLYFTANKMAQYYISISDLNGRQQLRTSFISTKGQNAVPLDVQHFAKGIYNITLFDEKGNRQSTHLLKL